MNYRVHEKPRHFLRSPRAENIKRLITKLLYPPLKAERANDAKVYEVEKFTTYTLSGYKTMHYSIKMQVFPVSNKIAIFAPN